MSDYSKIVSLRGMVAEERAAALKAMRDEYADSILSSDCNAFLVWSQYGYVKSDYPESQMALSRCVWDARVFGRKEASDAVRAGNCSATDAVKELDLMIRERREELEKIEAFKKQIV